MSMIIGRKQIILAALVVALAAAIFLNWRYTQPGASLANATSKSSALGDTNYVNAKGSAVSSNDYFAQASITRQQTRDQAKEVLNSIATNSAATDAQRTQALKDIEAMAQNIQNEGNIENLVKAKGFKGCVAVIDNGSVTVVVKPKSTASISQTDIAQIKDIVMTAAKVSADKITITQAK